MAQVMSALALLGVSILCFQWRRTIMGPTGVLSGMWAGVLFGRAAIAPDLSFSSEAGLTVIFLCAAFLWGELFFGMAVKAAPARQEGSRPDPRLERRLRMIIWGLGLSSVLGSVLYFLTFIRFFGSPGTFFSAGSGIREAMYGGELSVSLPVRAVSLVSYLAVSLALVYWIKFRFGLFLLLPYASVLVFGLAQAGRAGLLIVFLQTFLASYWQDLNRGRARADFRLGRRVLALALVVMVVFFSGQMFRNQSYRWSREEIRDQFGQFTLYAFGGVSAFSRYWSDRDFAAPATGGRYTFSSLYQLLGIRAQEAGIYDRYVSISDRRSEIINVYTAFRPLVEDFGVGGAVLFLFLLGLLSAAAFQSAQRGSPSALAILLASFTFLVFSVIAPLTQFNSFLLSATLGPFLLFILSARSAEERKV